MIYLVKRDKGQLARELAPLMNITLDLIKEEYSERKINKLVLDEYRKRQKK